MFTLECNGVVSLHLVIKDDQAVPTVGFAEKKRETMTTESEPNESTKEAEQVDAAHSHSADRPPTAEEADAAERGAASLDADMNAVAEHAEEMAELGADVKGEGEIK